mmetsp:Transcript_29336/g.62899  ORF Transcript_29336/g.62899 Transcript_29336/m.62899 type:complete len:233 (-) Transcript_29336:1018-1716(-)
MGSLSGPGQGLRLGRAPNKNKTVLPAGNVLQRHFQAPIVPARGRSTERGTPQALVHVPGLRRALLQQRRPEGSRKHQNEKGRAKIRLPLRFVAGDDPEGTRRPATEKGPDVPLEPNVGFGILHGRQGPGGVGTTLAALRQRQALRRFACGLPIGRQIERKRTAGPGDCQTPGTGSDRVDLFLPGRPARGRKLLPNRRSPGVVWIGRGGGGKTQGPKHERRAAKRQKRRQRRR